VVHRIAKPPNLFNWYMELLVVLPSTLARGGAGSRTCVIQYDSALTTSGDAGNATGMLTSSPMDTRLFWQQKLVRAGLSVMASTDAVTTSHSRFAKPCSTASVLAYLPWQIKDSVLKS
jgi:hypothetical protein